MPIYLGQEEEREEIWARPTLAGLTQSRLAEHPGCFFYIYYVLGFWPRQLLALQYTPFAICEKTTFAKNKRRPHSTPVPTEPSPSSAALGEHWQAVVRANVGAARQPLVDAPGVEDVAACVSKGVESVTVSTEQI